MRGGIMAGNTFGKLFRVTTFGESHGKALGCIIDGIPAGIKIDLNLIQSDLDRRRPGQTNSEGKTNINVTSRNEKDKVEILSGLFNEITTGCPIALQVENTNIKSNDYSEISNKFRPGHADYTFYEKYGIRDYRGGGRSSGRETVARVAAGAIAKNVLTNFIPSYSVIASTIQIGEIKANEFDKDFIEHSSVRCADKNASLKMEEYVQNLRKNKNSCGGIIQCKIKGLLAGLGEPVFDKLDAVLSHAILSIGAIKGIEFGKGFESVLLTGKEWNDEMYMNNNKPAFYTNNCGGILGGISNGNEITFNVAVKPVPSIFLSQKTIDTNYQETEILIEGRHDVCLCPRIIPVIEAMTNITILDLFLQNLSAKKSRIK